MLIVREHLKKKKKKIEQAKWLSAPITFEWSRARPRIVAHTVFGWYRNSERTRDEQASKMVNKQYNVQGLNKKLKQQNSSPPLPPTTTHIHMSNADDSGAFHNDDFDVIDHSDDNTSKIGSSLSSNDHHKDLSINDIGRFQYILQMDRELVSERCSAWVALHIAHTLSAQWHHISILCM